MKRLVILLIELMGILMLAESEIAPVQQQVNMQQAVETPKVLPKERNIMITPDNLEEEAYWDSVELISICVEAEAGNQSLLGRRLVVDVILNRVDDPDFPDTIEGVITQPRHFSSYWDGRMAEITEPSELTLQAVQMELEQRSYPGLLYFGADGYSEYGTPWKRIGEHYFSTK